MIATYAEYVWSCYIITAAVLLVIVWTGHRSHAKELQALRRRQQMLGNASHSDFEVKS